jgi:hypothetical protein
MGRIFGAAAAAGLSDLRNACGGSGQGPTIDQGGQGHAARLFDFPQHKNFGLLRPEYLNTYSTAYKTTRAVLGAVGTFYSVGARRHFAGHQ